MRLTVNEISTIKRAVFEHDKNAEIYLFGSRVDDSAKGGDLDILVMSKVLDFEMKLKIRIDILKHLGQQKLDLIIAKDDSKAFIRIAKSKGVRL